MAVTQIPGNVFRADYMQESTDPKPTGCEKNSLLIELDTGDIYYYTGAQWKKVGWNS